MTNELSRVKSGSRLWGSKESSKFLHSQQVTQPAEVFLALFFDREQHLISVEEVFCGSEHGTTVYRGESLINDVVERTSQHQAVEVSFIHYLPNFDGCPMPIDIALGQGLLNTLEATQAKLLDYLIMGKGRSISLFERQFLV